MNINGKANKPNPSNLSNAKNSIMAIPIEKAIKRSSILNSFFERIELVPILLITSEILAKIRSVTRKDKTTKS